MLTAKQLTKLNQTLKQADDARAHAAVELANKNTAADPKKVADHLRHSAALLIAAADAAIGK